MLIPEKSNAGYRILTYSERFIGVFHGGSDDLGAVDAILMTKLLGLVEPFSGHEPQLAPVTHSPLEVPECRYIRGSVVTTYYSEHSTFWYKKLQVLLYL